TLFIYRICKQYVLHDSQHTPNSGYSLFNEWHEVRCILFAFAFPSANYKSQLPRISTGLIQKQKRACAQTVRYYIMAFRCSEALTDQIRHINCSTKTETLPYNLSRKAKAYQSHRPEVVSTI